MSIDRTTSRTHRVHRLEEAPLGRRRIGPVGAGLRVLVAAGLLYLAGGADGLSWSVTWYDAAVGLAGLPALTVVLGLAARRRTARPIRHTGPLAHALNCALILVLTTNPYTGAAAALFYGAALLGAAWRAQPGCEVTVLSNWILHRDDQVGCPLFGPIDAAEARHALLRGGRARPRLSRPPVASARAASGDRGRGDRGPGRRGRSGATAR